MFNQGEFLVRDILIHSWWIQGDIFLKQSTLCVRISMLTLQTVNGISGIQKDNPGYKNSICKFHFIYLQILRTLGEFKWYIWFICSYCLTFIFLMASGEYIHWFDFKIRLWMRTGLSSVDVWFFHCLFSNFVKTKLQQHNIVWLKCLS